MSSGNYDHEKDKLKFKQSMYTQNTNHLTKPSICGLAWKIGTDNNFFNLERSIPNTRNFTLIPVLRAIAHKFCNLTKYAIQTSSKKTKPILSFLPKNYVVISLNSYYMSSFYLLHLSWLSVLAERLPIPLKNQPLGCHWMWAAKWNIDLGGLQRLFNRS